MRKNEKNFLKRTVFIFVLAMVLLPSISFGTSNLTSVQDVSSSILNTTMTIGIISIFIAIGIPVIAFIVGTIIFIRAIKNTGQVEKRVKGAKITIVILIVCCIIAFIISLVSVISTISYLNSLTEISNLGLSSISDTNDSTEEELLESEYKNLISEWIFYYIALFIITDFWILYYIIGLIVIYRMYKTNPLFAAKMQRIFAIILISSSLINTLILGINNYGFSIVAIQNLLLSLISIKYVVLVFLIYDSIIVRKAITLNGHKYDEVDKNKKIILGGLSALMIIVYLISPFYAKFITSKIQEDTEELIYKNYQDLSDRTEEALNQYNESQEDENKMLQNLMDYIDSSIYEPETNNNILGYDNSIDNYYIDNTVIDNNINESNIISNSVSGDNNTINNEIIDDSNVINNISDTNSVISDNTISNNVTSNTVNNTINLDLPQLEQLVGDINGDEKVSMADLSLLKGHIVKNKILEGAQYSAADINADGNISMTDFAKLKVIILGL